MSMIKQHRPCGQIGVAQFAFDRNLLHAIDVMSDELYPAVRAQERLLP